MNLDINTAKKRQVVDITEQVQEVIGPDSRLVNVFAAHTTCAVTTADLDPGTDEDLLDALQAMIPKLDFRHPHDPSHAHVLSHLASSIIGPGLSLPIKDGQLLLGTWQRIILVELDGPRNRKLVITTCP
jgi:secondary thiamine-phosphate synthase enzyme